MAMKLTNHPLFPRMCLETDPDGSESSPGGGTPSPESGHEELTPGHEEERDLTKLSEEELKGIIAEEESEDLAKLFGAGRYKTYEEALRDFAKQRREGSSFYTRFEKMAKKANLKPEAIMDHLEKQVGLKERAAAPAAEPTGKESDQALQEVKNLGGRLLLDNKFMRFVAQMDKENVDIPDELQEKLDELIPSVIHGKSEKELASFNPYPKAYRLHLFNLTDSGEKSLEEVEEDLVAIKAIREKKKRQLKIPSTSSRQAVPADKKETANWGAVDKL